MKKFVTSAILALFVGQASATSCSFNDNGQLECFEETALPACPNINLEPHLSRADKDKRTALWLKKATRDSMPKIQALGSGLNAEPNNRKNNDEN